MRNYVPQLIFVAFLASCSGTPEMPLSYLPEHANWEEERVQLLYAPEGFLNLAGLYWMEPGEYTFGSDSASDLIFPEDFPAATGSFFVTRNRVLMTPASGAEITVNGESMTDPTIVYDEETNKILEMAWGEYRWHVIERAGNIGLRLRDLRHPALYRELDIPKFPVDYRWVVRASYVPYETPRTVSVDNVIGFNYQMKIAGQLRFELDGQDMTLEPIIEGDKYFIIYSDDTSGEETYGSGRYLYADIPEEGDEVILDFNKSKNPPCAFTDFATCLIPPPENRLALRIEAGEKDYHLPE